MTFAAQPRTRAGIGTWIVRIAVGMLAGLVIGMIVAAVVAP